MLYKYFKKQRWYRYVEIDWEMLLNGLGSLELSQWLGNMKSKCSVVLKTGPQTEKKKKKCFALNVNGALNKKSW